MPHKPCVLFVDDEPRILDGLRRMLHGLRHDWDMAFVETGAEALARLDRESFDVIVTDMHMPHMNGAQLLTEVRRHYPQVVRIVLSGAADQSDILNALGPIHQYLAKPCEADTLKMTLSRVAALPDWLADTSLRQLILQTETLPSWPLLYDEFIRELTAPTPALPVIGDIIARDIGLAAKMMQLAQSAVFSARSISSLTEAVAFLGVNTLQMIAASGQVFARLDTARQGDLSITALWEHSVLVGRLAHRIALAEGANQQTLDYAAIAGLLHDVGKLVLAANLPEQYAAALALATQANVSVEQAERQIFHATHAEVGAYLLSLWGLAEPIVAAAAFHHGPQVRGFKCFNVITAVYAADCLIHHQTADAMPLDITYLAGLGLAERLTEWQRLCQLTLQEKDTP